MIRARDGFAYGLLGFPLAFAALPLYVHLPNHYAREFAVPLATLGGLLLAARLLDAVLDPWIGGIADRLFARGAKAVLAAGAAAGIVLALGLWLLFFPPSRSGGALLAWAAAALMFTYIAFSLLTVAHQAWGAMLASDDAQRSRYVAWREGLGLAGVLVASVLPTLAGMGTAVVALAVALPIAWLAWTAAPRPVPRAIAGKLDRTLPLRDPAFRSLLAVFVLNGIASAIPATLVLFFVQDRLAASPAHEPWFLATYFLAAAASIPVWLKIADRLGLAGAWLLGVGLAVVVFIFAAALGTGDTAAFLVVCALSGFALGADLALPGALLAGVIDRAGLKGRGEGLYFGWWNLATKANLALAAGLALPLLAAAGYSPGARDEPALAALTVAYCVLPCILKCGAGALLYFQFIRKAKIQWSTT